MFAELIRSHIGIAVLSDAIRVYYFESNEAISSLVGGNDYNDDNYIGRSYNIILYSFSS